MKVHFSDLRLYVNAGMRFPTCHAGAALLDCDKGRWNLTTNRDKVTCIRCKQSPRYSTIR